MYPSSVPNKEEAKLRIVTSRRSEMETSVNKIRLSPLLQNCLVLKTERANPGFSRGSCVPLSCWL